MKTLAVTRKDNPTVTLHLSNPGGLGFHDPALRTTDPNAGSLASHGALGSAA